MTKAIRTQIKLGSIDLDVFQMPDGSYRMSQTQVCNSVNKPPKRIIELAGSKKGKILTEQGFEKGLKVSVEGSKPVNIVSLDVAFQFWVLELTIGNTEALALVSACGIEALERRADAAFNVKRTEEERNQRIETRINGILSRNFWTDVIAEYLKTHEVSANYERFIWIHVSDLVNRAIFGMNSKKVREHYGARDNDSLRDFLPSDTLRLIDAIEKGAAIRLRHNDLCPKQALKDVICLYGVVPGKDFL